MIPPWLLAPAGLLLVLLALLLDRRFGFLPIDVPHGGRKRHPRPTPMVGVVLGAAAAVGWIARAPHQWPVGAALFLTTAVGGFDDHRKQRRGGWSWRAKALLLLVAAALALGGLLPPERWFGGEALGALALLFVLTNAVNFLDNTDGVSTVVGALGLVLAGGDPALAVGCLYLGFLPLNWPRALAFPGDAGALTLGLALGCAVVTRTGTQHDVWAALAPAAVPLLDFGQVVCARLWLGLPPWVGDRRHLTHIAIALGVPERLIAPLFGGLAALSFWLLGSRT